MRQTLKGAEWHFGMNAHIGVDSRLKIVHSFAATPANVHDSRLLPELLHGNETRVWGDAAYRWETDLIRAYAPQAVDFTHHYSGRRKGLSKHERHVHRTKARVSAGSSTHFTLSIVFLDLGKLYRGIAKNAHRLIINFALSNLYLHRRLNFQGRSVSRNQNVGLPGTPEGPKTRKSMRQKPQQAENIAYWRATSELP